MHLREFKPFYKTVPKVTQASDRLGQVSFALKQEELDSRVAAFLLEHVELTSPISQGNKGINLQITTKL